MCNYNKKQELSLEALLFLCYRIAKGEPKISKLNTSKKLRTYNVKDGGQVTITITIPAILIAVLVAFLVLAMRLLLTK